MARRRSRQTLASHGIGTGTAMLLGLLPGSFIYFCYGLANQRDVLTFFGFCGLVIVAIGALVVLTKASQRKKIRSQRNFSVVITPTGLALCQRELKGELRWDEIREVRLRQRGGRLTVTAEGAAAGIELQVPGAVIKILDLYDRPLAAIHERIVQNWQGPA